MNPSNRVFLGVVGASLIAATALWEGDKRLPYKDIVGVVTVCYGYTGKDIQMNKVYSKAECDNLLKRELVKYNVGVLNCINVPVSKHEVDAYTLFAYNVGIQGFCRSSLLRQLNAGNHIAACNGLTAWSYAGGKYVQGLRNRRLYEREMCLGALK